MTKKLNLTSIICEVDFNILFDNASFPMTKAELIYKAKKAGVSLSLLELVYSLPSRFYRSRADVINHCISRKFRTIQPLILMSFAR